MATLYDLVAAGFRSYPSSGGEFAVKFENLWSFILAPCVWFLLAYYFIYRKNGSKFLMVNIIIIPIFLIGIHCVPNTFHPIDKLFDNILGFYFWINCLRLYKTNNANSQLIRSTKQEESEKNNREILSNSEKIRSDWFKIIRIFYFCTLSLALLSISLLLFEETPILKNQGFWESLTLSIGATVLFGLMYYFGYRKHGTKWLCWILGLSICDEARTIILTLYEKYSAPHLTIYEVAYFLFIYVPLTTMFVYFWIYTKRLYDLNKINKKLKKEQKRLQLQKNIVESVA